MGLSDKLLNSDKRAMVVDDCCKLLETQLTSKSGISGLGLKAAYSALKGVKPGYIAYAVEQLLPDCFTALDPMWNEGVQNGDPVAHLATNKSRTADALLSITDARAKKVSRPIVRGTYEKLRGSVKPYIEEAIPDFAKVINKYA
ncbi:hypothetical protein IQ244_09355 [Nostoc sp. LEGE 06077]|uniref:DUF6918 family protein n=1 Tax=Nostoc sp. LEGE 06077 TaxID=915325 RepID=UPI00187E99A4|nr:hypothetical protein [Nostoc sp. LEGE 06077]MBE9206715.1 hypothetical protein [Nostoc sp. LEGE 06077]